MNQQVLESRTRLKEELDFLVRGEAHDSFHAGTVVPAAIEQNHLTGGRKVRDVTLEVPLRLLGNRGFFQCHDSCATGIEVFHEALYRATLTGRIPAFKQNHNLLAGIFDPFLHL